MPVDASTSTASSALTLTQRLADYIELTKPEISFLVTVSALAGFLLGSVHELNGWTLIVTLVGVGLSAGGAGALNHFLEHEIDAQMKRTRDRPLPAGRVSPIQARNFGALLVIAGVGLLCPFTNPQTAVLAALTVVLYLFVYTPLKRKTQLNTLIGTLPGALPALGGYVAATGTLGAAGALWFGILVAWQMPHFLALAWMYRKDYARGKYAMLPVLEPSGDSTARQMIGFTSLMVLLSIVLAIHSPSLGWIFGLGAAITGGMFLAATIRFHGDRTGKNARGVLKASVYYIPAIVLLILVDWFVV